MQDEDGATATRTPLGMVAEYYSILGLIARLYILPVLAYLGFVMAMAWCADAVLTPMVEDRKVVGPLTLVWIVVSTLLIAVPAGIFSYGIHKARSTGR